jgi:hypothetical protein
MTSPYVHALAGRIRIKILGVRGSEAEARVLEKELGAVPGVEYVKANPKTGNVLIHYEQDEIEQTEIIGILRRAGWLALNNSHPQMAAGLSPSHIDIHDLALRLVEKIVAAFLEIFFLRLLQLA